MTISNRISQLDFSHDLTDVKELLKIAQGSTTFWGKRVITVPDLEGTFPLDEVARKVITAAADRCQDDDLTAEERLTGLAITDRLRSFYVVTDEHLAGRNWFTRLLNKIREFTFSSVTPRFTITNGHTDNVFKAYSEKRFIQEFGNEKDDQGRYVRSDGAPDEGWVIANLAAIRTKLNPINES